jgi:hypothetical protein
VNHVEEAKRALAVADWPRAASHVRAALEQKPDSLFLHYNLAVCATWLGSRDEAQREFEWVLAHAPFDSEEATTARRWLASGNAQAPIQAAAEPGNPDLGDAGVHGVVLWAEPGQVPKPQGRLQIFLHGLRNTPTAAHFYWVRSDEEGRYQFTRIVPGQYKLSDAIARPKWRLKIVVEPGEDALFDLTLDNVRPARDDFPQDG